jgi:putative flippase GtrA
VTTAQRCPAAAERFGELSARMRKDDGVAQFIRFAFVGGVTTAVYAAMFVSLSRLLGFGYLSAHLISTVLTTVLANEMHRRLTFHADERVDFFTAQWEAGIVAAIGLLSTSAALTWLDSTAHSVPAILQIALVVAVTTTIGIIRFIALRWIFRPGMTARS